MSYTTMAHNMPGGNSNQISTATTTTNTTISPMATTSGRSANAIMITNFWNNNALPANTNQHNLVDLNVSSSLAALLLHSMQLPLSNSAKAVVVMGVISKASNFIVAYTRVSHTSSWGRRIMRQSSTQLTKWWALKFGDNEEGIPEEEDCRNAFVTGKKPDPMTYTAPHGVMMCVVMDRWRDRW